MLTPAEITQCAAETLQRHGDGAGIYAVIRVLGTAADGDRDGYQDWVHVASALSELKTETPTGTGH